MVERAPDKCEVVGSNPTWAKIRLCFYLSFLVISVVSGIKRH